MTKTYTNGRRNSNIMCICSPRLLGITVWNSGTHHFRQRRSLCIRIMVISLPPSRDPISLYHSFSHHSQSTVFFPSRLNNNTTQSAELQLIEQVVDGALQQLLVSTTVYTMQTNTPQLQGTIHLSRNVYGRPRVHTSGFIRETSSITSIQGTLPSPQMHQQSLLT